MATVNALTYIGVRSPEVEPWRDFATALLGMQIADGSTDDCLLLRMDDRHHRIAVQQGEPGLAYLGFEVATRQALNELVAKLAAGGVTVEEDKALAAQRRVHDLYRCQDPAGNQVELVAGQLSPKTAFASPRGVTFKTGEQGLGHVFMLVPEFEPTWHFYVDLLGLRLSDTIGNDAFEGTFLHCNPRHHTLAFAAAGFSAMLHVMVEVDSLEAVGRAYDIVRERGLPVSMSLGMHTNDHMVSFYVPTPAGFDIEYGTGGRAIDDTTWTVGHYNDISYWGHHRAEPAEA